MADLFTTVLNRMPILHVPENPQLEYELMFFKATNTLAGYLMAEVEKVVSAMLNSERIAAETGDDRCRLTYMHLPNEFSAFLAKGTIFGIRCADLLYGDYAGSWCSRTWKHSFEKAWTRVQFAWALGGVSVYDASDPAKRPDGIPDRHIRIWVSLFPPARNTKYLWHGHNKLPSILYPGEQAVSETSDSDLSPR